MLPVTTIEKPFTAFDANQLAKTSDLTGSVSANKFVDIINKKIKEIAANGGYNIIYHFDNYNIDTIDAVKSYYERQHYDVKQSHSSSISLSWRSPKTVSEKEDIELLKAIHGF